MSDGHSANNSGLQDFASHGSGQNNLNSFQVRARSTTAGSLIFSDLCDKHGDRLIAFDVKSGEIICNRCVYGRQESNFQFSSTIAKKVSISEKQKYNDLEKALDSLQQVAPTKISKDLQSCVSTFLEEVMGEITVFVNNSNAHIFEADSEDTNKQSMEHINRDIQRSHSVKNAIDQHLRATHFTVLAKQHDVFRNEIRAARQAGERMDKIVQDGLAAKRQREAEFGRNMDALKKVITDITNCNVMDFIENEKEVLGQRAEGQNVQKMVPPAPQKAPEVSNQPQAQNQNAGS